jgi:hypothetical protein
VNEIKKIVEEENNRKKINFSNLMDNKSVIDL